jgi:hypothetical protein
MFLVNDSSILVHCCRYVGFWYLRNQTTTLCHKLALLYPTYMPLVLKLWLKNSSYLLCNSPFPMTGLFPLKYCQPLIRRVSTSLLPSVETACCSTVTHFLATVVSRQLCRLILGRWVFCHPSHSRVLKRR